ncbi:MAG: UDP-N-acetylglucosamine 1-carboxyvinyltransferase [Candidatus Roizmanbacteria bacterium GW2011_GWA2_37_7]|uniref:UDP-N-acetylglucosamine 1-carboxyvinyltransferase n=1 Tax=Candidatus Roizmanbacteria bacterium GW2011_GWA2_37_7 TaxID=1618481 RepID=A0A0G0H960_9BACT|nr:MAG: UDP-N-acetylglucosamine 1-carboxyvinyltransferase [Candidatus Roizmanbacteria bacterium GW2011_GWA2_37_7]
MEDAYVIKGARPLKGKLQLSGAKNIALKVLIAALLFDSPVVLHNIPRICDIEALIDLLKLLGVQIYHTHNTVTIDPRTLQKNKVDLLHASKIRVSFLLFAPLLYTFQKAEIPNPGGCRLGARSIDRIVDGLRTLGVMITYNSKTGYYEASILGQPHGEYTFEKPSHTGTELMIMMSVFCDGVVRIKNAAQEPEIDDLITMLNEGGANIHREDCEIIIKGVHTLTQKKPFTISADRVEAVTYAVLGIATRGDITISKIPDHYILAFIDVLQNAGAGVEQKGHGVWRFYYKPMRTIDIETAPHPGFLTDWQPLLAVLMTQVKGKSTIHERIFENRFSYVEELRKLGATVEFIKPMITNPHEYYFFNYEAGKEYMQSIAITGPLDLHGGVLTVSDLRAGATLAIAALVADGESYVKGVHHIERGYENFVEKVRSLGGEIRKF